MIELLGLLAAGAGATYGWWKLQRARGPSGLKLLESRLDTDANVAFGVATHAVTARAHPAMVPLHLLYGLLQVETFTDAITKLGGSPDAIEGRVLEELEEPLAHVDLDARMLGGLLSYVYAVADATGRPITIVDLWARLALVDVARLVEIEPHELTFLLVHGMAAPPPDLPDRVDVHVILRNDDYTTQEFVSSLLVEVFGLSSADAHTRMLETHTQGKAIVGRFKRAVARDKVITARARAREAGFPLWVGVEDC